MSYNMLFDLYFSIIFLYFDYFLKQLVSKLIFRLKGRGLKGLKMRQNG